MAKEIQLATAALNGNNQLRRRHMKIGDDIPEERKVTYPRTKKNALDYQEWRKRIDKHYTKGDNMRITYANNTTPSQTKASIDGSSWRHEFDFFLARYFSHIFDEMPRVNKRIREERYVFILHKGAWTVG